MPLWNWGTTMSQMQSVVHYHLLRKEHFELTTRNPNKVTIRVNEHYAVSRMKRRLELCAVTAYTPSNGKVNKVVVKICICDMCVAYDERYWIT